MDTGFSSGVSDLTEMAEASGGSTHEIVRLESVAEEAAAARATTPRRSSGSSPSGRRRHRHQVDPGLPRRVSGRPVRTRRHRGGRGSRALARRRRHAMHRQGASAIRPVSGVAAGQTAAVPYRFRRSGLRPAHHQSDVPARLSPNVGRHPGDVAALLPVRASGLPGPGFQQRLPRRWPRDQLPRCAFGCLHRPVVGDGALPQGPVLVGRIRPGRTALPRSTVWRNGIRDVLQGFVDHDEWSEPMRSGSST